MSSVRISGPVSAYSLIHEGKKYYFFGDIHRSTSGTCPPPCNLRTRCFNITTLLTDIFLRAKSKNQWVDFYLEVPFVFREGNYRYPRLYARKPKHNDIIRGIYNYFRACFTKLPCIFPTTRFHSVDIRQVPELNNGVITPRSLTYEHYIITRVNRCLNKLLKMFLFQLNQKDEYVENTNLLINDLYRVPWLFGGEPKNKLLARIYLESDNYYNDVRDLLYNGLNGIKGDDDLKDIERHLFPEGIIVERDGKYMHKVQVQLYELSKESRAQSVLATKIKRFCLHQYDKHMNNSRLLYIWTNIFYLYQIIIQRAELPKWIESTPKEFKTQFLFTEWMGRVVYSNAMIMDAYTLGRMFRKYPNSKNHIDSDRVIVYAGDAHIENYCDFFLQTFGSKIKGYNPNEDLIATGNLDDVTRCVDVDINDFD